MARCRQKIDHIKGRGLRLIPQQGVAMKEKIKELQKLQGVGDILSQRFVEAGYDTFAKVAAAGEKGLGKIPGVNPRMLGAIVAQAAALSAGTATGKARKTEELKLRLTSLKEQVQAIALSIQDRFKDELTGKARRKLEKRILKVLGALEQAEGRAETRVKKAGRVLVKAEGMLEGLTVSSLAKVGKGLKRARKSLKTIGGR
jgi:endonuclease III